MPAEAGASPAGLSTTSPEQNFLRAGPWRGRTALAVALLCALFGGLSWMAARGKSATVDEPAHAVVGWMMLHRGDYRFSPDLPPLWEKYVALAMGTGAIEANWSDPAYRHITRLYDARDLVKKYLFQTPQNNGAAIIAHGRLLCLILGLALIVVLACWAWELCGAVGAIVAALLIALDPNFLGHAPLIKNDVATSLLYFASAYALWRLGKRLTLLNAFVLAMLVAATLMTKLTGALLGPILVIALALRAGLNQPWVVLGMSLARRLNRLLAAAVLCVFIAVVTYLVTWASYGFTFDPSPPGTHFPDRYVLGGSSPSLPAATDSIIVRCVGWIESHHLMPKPWCAGILISPTTGFSSGQSFVFGAGIYSGGKWFYFPLAALFKTPLMTLLATGLLLVFLQRWRAGLHDPARLWTAIAIALPFAVYVFTLLILNLNIGIRHALPAYPFVYLVIAWMAACFWSVEHTARFTVARGIILAMGVVLAAESFIAFPNYIAYFNLACGGPSSQFNLLTDSNLDWGQDLPLLAQWEETHPGIPVHLYYFNEVDPAYYGVQTVSAGQAAAGVLAIGETRLRFLSKGNYELYRTLMQRPPTDILGGSIYIYPVGSNFKMGASASRPSP